MMMLNFRKGLKLRFILVLATCLLAALHLVLRFSVSHLLEVPVCPYCLCKKILIPFLSLTSVKHKGKVPNR